MSFGSGRQTGAVFKQAGRGVRRPSSSDACPCGRGEFGTCCGPVLDGGLASTAEDLMRSRYTAFVVGDEDHLFRTWHPRNRPADVGSDELQWTGLRIIDIVDGGIDDVVGVVEFVASYVTPEGKAGQLRERSRFVRRAGRWMYLDAEG